MSPLPRRCAVAAITLTAMGGGAVPALAAAPNPLVQAIDSVSTTGGKTSVLETINENLHTAAGDRAAIVALVTNAYNCDQAAALVAPIPASSDQQTAKAHWLEGVRLQARVDVQDAAGVISILTGHTTAGFAELKATDRDSNHANVLTGGADNTLGVKTLPAPQS